MKNDLVQIQKLIHESIGTLIDEMKTGDRVYFPDQDGLDDITDPQTDDVINALRGASRILDSLLESQNEKH